MELLSTDQAAEILKVTPSLVRRYCRQGRLGMRVGGRWVVTRDELDAFAARPRPEGYPKGRQRSRKKKDTE